MSDHGVTHKLSSKQSIYENATRALNGRARRAAQFFSEFHEELQVFIDENAGEIDRAKLEEFVRGLKKNKHMAYMLIRKELYDDRNWVF